MSEEARREPPARVTLTELLQAAEAERARIADELHDDAVQALTACLLHLSLVEDRMGEVRTMGAYRSARDNLERGLRAARALLTELRAPTLEAHGAAAALNQRLQRLTPQGGEVARLDWRVPERLDPHAETLLFRAVQQALPTPSLRTPLPLASLTVTAAPRAGGVTAEVTWTLTTEGPPPREPEPEPEPAPAAQPLAYQLIRLAGGTVHAQTHPRGTTVRVWLPLELPDEPVW